MMKDNVGDFYFVATPLQYLNAREARCVIGVASPAYLFILVKSDMREREIEKLLKKSDWDSVTYLDVRKITARKLTAWYSLPSVRSKLDGVIRSIAPGSGVFVGNFNEVLFKYILKKTEDYAHQYLLDDGFATLDIYADKPPVPVQIRKPITMYNYLLSLGLGLSGFRLHPEITFFTVFDFKVATGGRKIVKNNFSQLRAELQHERVSLSNCALFIGQPLVESGYINRALYNKQISGLQKFYEDQGLAFVYCLHPAEQADALPSSLEIRKPEGALEIFLLKQPYLPRVFATCFSSACFNLSMILQERHEFHYWILNGMPQHVVNNRVYQYVDAAKLPWVILRHYDDKFKEQGCLN